MLFGQDCAYIGVFRFLCVDDGAVDNFLGDMADNGDLDWSGCVSLFNHREVRRYWEMFGGFGVSLIGIARTDNWTNGVGKEFFECAE